MTGTVAAIAVLAGIFACLIWLYNRLVRLRNFSRSSWSDIDVLLKKRHDLVGNLVESVKGYAAYEKAVLQGVTEARARAMRAESPGERGKEENLLREKIASLFAVAESYPDLKASESYLLLQKQLAEIENGIEYARRYYNAVVRDYNTAAETFPSNLFSRAFGFWPAEFFQLDAPGERGRTDVRLSALLLLFAVLAPWPARAEDFTIRSFRAAIEGRGDAANVSELKLSFYKNIDALKASAFEGLKGLKCFTAEPSKVQGKYVGIGVLVLFGGILLSIALAAMAGDAFALAVPAAILSGFSILLFAPVMPVKTPKGVKLLGRVKGFEEFLLRAEKDRLERMNDKNLFEKYLPYAIALGVSDRWAESFEGIYQEPPDWYVSPGGIGSFRPASFNSSLGTALSSMSSAMTASPRSGGSGFSGGGSSGGGGGGGGGGSW